MMRRLLATSLATGLLWTGTAKAGPICKSDPIPLTASATLPYTLDLRTILSDQGSGTLVWSTFPNDKPAWVNVDSPRNLLFGTPGLGDVGDTRFRVSVKDDDAGTICNLSMTVVVTPVWASQTIDLGKQKEDSAWSFNLRDHLTVPGNGPVTFSATGLRPWMQLSPNGMLTGTPRRPDVESYSGIRLVATTPSGGRAEADAFGLVEKTIHPPRWKENPVLLPNANEDFSYQQEVSGKVDNFEQAALTFTLVQGTTTGWLQLSQAGTLTGIPGKADVGHVKIKARVSATIDGQTYTDDAFLEFDVIHTNHPPKWLENPISLSNATVNVPFSFDLKPKATDPDEQDTLSFSLQSGPSWLKVTTEGKLTGTPRNEHMGANEWTVRVSDGQIFADTVVRLTVVKRPAVWSIKPVVLPNAQEDFLYSQSLVSFVTNPDGDPLTFTVVSGPTWATVTSQGTLMGTPGAADVGPNTFQVKLSNGGLTPDDTADIQVTVLHTNHKPQWLQDPIQLPNIPERVAYSVELAPFAKDPDAGDTLTFSKINGPAWASVSVTGQLFGTPQRPNVGNNQFKVRVTDQGGLSAEVTVNVTVDKVPLPPRWKQDPIALGDATQDTPFTFDLAPLAESQEGLPLTFTKVSGPTWLQVASNGKITGTPALADVGTVTAVFEVSDGLTARATGQGRVLKKFYPPVIHAHALQFTIKEREVFTENLNQPKYVEDKNGDPLTFTLLDSVEWVTLIPEGGLTASPQFKHIGNHSLRFRVSNGVLATDGVIKITVVRDPRPPVWLENPIRFEAKARVAFSASIADKAKDLDGLPITFAKKSGPAWLRVSADGKLSGTPPDGDVGENKFVLTVWNDQKSADADLIVQVLFNPHPPVIHEAALSFTVKERSTLVENLNQPQYVQSPDGRPLTFVLLTSSGWVTLDATGKLTATPVFKDIGDHAFRFRVEDGLLSTEGTLRIKVIRDPRPPVWLESPVVFQTKARVPFTASVADKAKDLDGFPITFSKKAGPAWLSVAANGQLSGTPGDEHVGDNSFTVTVKNDLLGADNTLVVKVLFNNHAPYWTADPIVLPQGTATEAYQQSVASFAKDPDPQDTLTFTKVSGPAWASVTPTGQVVGTPGLSDIGITTLEVRVTDPEGLSATTRVKITLIKPNTPPRWLQDPITLADAQEDRNYAFDLGPLAKDDDGDRLTFKKVSGPDWLFAGTDGKLTGIPNKNHLGDYTAIFEVTDGKAAVQVRALGRVLHTPHPPIIHAQNLFFTIKERQVFTENLNQAKYVESTDGDPLTFTLLDTAPWVTLSPQGMLTASPERPQIGDHSFRFRAANGPAYTDGVLRIKVIRDPRPPVWSSDPIVFSTKARVPFSASVADKVTDPDGLPLTFSKKSGPTWLIVHSDGKLTGTPQDGDLGENAFVVTAKNDQLGADATVIVRVLFNNHAPVWTQNPITLTQATATEAYAQTVSPFAHDPDPQDTLTFTKVIGPAWVQIGSDGSVTGTPALTDLGTATVQVKVSDPEGLSAVATVKIPVVKPNAPPKWLQDPVRLADATEATAYQFDLKPLVKDDDGDALTFKKISGPAWQQAASDGKLSGTPAKTDIGEYTAIFEVSDGKVAVQVSAVGRVLPNVHPPVIHADALVFTVKERSTFIENLNQKKYVEDLDGHPLTFTLKNAVEWLTLTPQGVMTASPQHPHIGNHLFDIEVTNGYLTSKGKLTVKVIRDPRPPIWLEDPIRFTAKARLPFSASVADKAKDLDQIPLSFSKKAGPAWLSVGADGKLTGTPQNDAVGENTFVVTARNDALGADVTVLVTVEANNQPPYWTENPVKLPVAKAKKLYIQSVASYAKDPDNDTLTFSKVSGPAWAAVTSSGTVMGTPDIPDVGPVTLKVLASDPWGGVAEGTIVFEVVPSSGPPQWLKDPIPLGDVRVGDHLSFDLAPFAKDNEGLPLTFKKVSGPLWLQCAPDGKLSGVPAETDVGAYTAVFETSNGFFVAQVNGFGRVLPKGNQPPIIEAGSLYFVMKEGEVKIENLNQPKYVYDPDGDPITFKIYSPEPWITLTTEGTLTLKPLSAQVGDHVFGIEVSDPSGHKANAPLFVKVLADPKPPVWLENPIRFTATVGEPFAATLADKVKGSVPMAFTKTSGPGWLVVGTDGKLSGTPKKENLGDNTFVVTAKNSVGQADVTVIVTVKEPQPHNDTVVIDTPVPGAKSEQLWVIDNAWCGSGTNPLVAGLRNSIGKYFDRLASKSVHHTGVYLSADAKLWKGIPIADAQGDVLFRWDDSDLVEGFQERLKVKNSGHCNNSPVWAMFRFYEQAPSLEFYHDGYFTAAVPMDALIVTNHQDQYKSFAKGTPQSGWNATNYAEHFIAFHQKEMQPYRISAIAPKCRTSADAEPVPDSDRAENPYRVLVEKTKGKYFPVGCDFNMEKALLEYADDIFFRTAVTAKRRIPLTKKPAYPGEIKVTLGGVALPGNTASATDKWQYDPAKNEIEVRWELIDLSTLKPGDVLRIEYRA